MRLQQSLAGSWQFSLDPEGSMRVESLKPDRVIKVPLPWQAAFPELETYSGYAWYAREIDLGDDWLAGEILLTFGAVDYWCEVFVNGQRVGEHEGGYTSFTFSVRSLLKAGKNQIAVRVYDAAYPGLVVPRWYDREEATNAPFNPLHVPHGKQSWYLECGGIWQDVTLTAVPAVYIDRVHITPNIHGDATIDIKLAGDLQSASGTIGAVIGDKLAEVTLVAGQSDYHLALHVDQAALWTPETPHLYTANIALSSATGADSQSIRFGFREIAVQNGQLLLNGEPIFMLSALDQDMYAETIYSSPSEAFLRDEFTKAKELGLNCLRIHIKPPEPLYLDLADEMGLLVWAEIPSWRTFYVKTRLAYARYNVTDDIKQRVSQTLREMITRDFNHPSLVVWSIVNEDWGTTVQQSPNDRAWLAAMYDECKQLDPTRLVVDNSACLTNVHVKSDIDDYHIYTNIPDQAGFFEQFITSFSQRAGWTYSGHGDVQRTGQEALILSEFGNWGLPSVDALRDASGNLPDWFKLGPWWSGWDGEPGFPNGVLDRFDRLGLKAIYGDYESFAKASQWHQYNAMKYEIEIMRRQPALAGYVITELSDIYWESNGLMDFNRGKKVYHDLFAQVNTPDVVIPRLTRYNAWEDDTLSMQVFASHYSAADATGAKITLSHNGKNREIPLPDLKRGGVVEGGVHELTFAPVKETSSQTVNLELSGTSGTLAKNQVDILVLPVSARQPAYTGSIAVLANHDPLTGDAGVPLAGTLQKVGYSVSRENVSGGLIVTDNPTENALRQVRDGGKMLYLSSGVGPFFWFQSRMGGTYSGMWMTSFTWLRPDIFKRLKVSNPLSLPYMAVMPCGVFLSVPVENAAYQQDFIGGQITGWIGHPAVHTLQFKYGRGTVLMTTYTLAAAINQPKPDAVGVAMLHDLIDYVVSDACRPTLTVSI